MTETITRMNPTTLPDAGKVGYSQISITQPGRLAYISGQVSWRADNGAVPGTLTEQSAIVVENLQGALAAIDAGPHDIVQMRVYMTDLRPQTLEIAMAKLVEFLKGAQPSLTGIGVAALAAPELQIEVEMVVQMPV